MATNKNDDFYCETCNKSYKDRSGLWKHNIKYHGNTDNQNDYHHNHKHNHIVNNEQKNEKTYECSKCGKSFSHFQNRWRHEKKCDYTGPKTADLAKIVSELKNEIVKLKELNKKPKKIKNYVKVNGNVFNANQLTNNQLTNNSNNQLTNNSNNLNNQQINSNNNFVINKIGTENIFELNESEIMEIFNSKLEDIIKLTENINFNERLCSNHNLCSTSLESIYCNVFDTETKTIVKDGKKYLFESIICNNISNHEKLYNKYKHKFPKDKQIKIEENIEVLKNIRESSFGSLFMKEMIKKLNILSYNKRGLIQNTWKLLKNEGNLTDEELEFKKLMLETKKEQDLLEEKNKVPDEKQPRPKGSDENKLEYETDSDYESESDYDSDSDKPRGPLSFRNRKKTKNLIL
jgi:DNA-directed RNA polymerase subunit RPC12/RpoP